MFDTLMYAKRLEAAGMTREQAEAQVNVIAEMVVNGVATKQDLAVQTAATQKEFAEIRTEIAELRLEMHKRFSDVYAEFASVRAEMAAAFHKQTIQTGVMIATSTSLTIAILMYFR